MPDAILIFAAGFGTRMGALTADRPKPLIEVGGQTLLDHALDLTGGIDRVVVNTHYRAGQIATHVAGRGVLLSHEAPQVLETGGGLRHALPLLAANPVFTLNSDAVWRGPNPLDILRATWAPQRMEALLLCVPKTRALGHIGPGDFETDAQGCASWGPGDIYTGAQILRTDRLESIEQGIFSLRTIWKAMIAERRLFTVPYPGHWCDVGRPEGIALAETMLAGDHV